jgi:hypothetical protein
MRTLGAARAWTVGLALLVALGSAACSSGDRTLPPPPATPEQNLGPSEPPVIWIGGTLSDVAQGSIGVTEPAGSEVKLRRLTGAATSFFLVSGHSWRRLGPKERIHTGEPVCVETLMDGATLLALRVFLGSDCGPR